MYIQSQDKMTMINFDNFHELYVNDTMICALRYQQDKKINIVLGRYENNEKAMEQFNNIMDDMINESGKLENVIIEVD